VSSLEKSALYRLRASIGIGTGSESRVCVIGTEFVREGRLGAGFGGTLGGGGLYLFALEAFGTKEVIGDSVISSSS